MDTELYELLTELGRKGFLVHSYRLDRDERPEIVAAVLNHDDCADVVILHGVTTAYAFRTPSGDGRDVLDPDEVWWDLAAKPVRTLRALLDLPAPGDNEAPTSACPPQTGLCLPVEQRGAKLTIRRRGI